MNALTITNTADMTMSSLDLLEMVNAARKEFGETEVRRNDFVARCKDELDGEYYETFVVKNLRGPASEAINMTRDQCMYVLMRESKAVRRSVTNRLKTLEAPALPATYSEALRALADKVEEAQRIEAERDRAIATKAEIGSRREATAMATASQAIKKAARLQVELDQSMQYATVKRMEMLYHGQKFNWRLLKSTAAEMDMPPIDVFDANYGKVKSYHADVWREAYALEINPHAPLMTVAAAAIEKGAAA